MHGEIIIGNWSISGEPKRICRPEIQHSAFVDHFSFGGSLPRDWINGPITIKPFNFTYVLKTRGSGPRALTYGRVGRGSNTVTVASVVQLGQAGRVRHAGAQVRFPKCSNRSCTRLQILGLDYFDNDDTGYQNTNYPRSSRALQVLLGHIQSNTAGLLSQRFLHRDGCWAGKEQSRVLP